MRDLVVLVADSYIKAAIVTILNRERALGIRDIDINRDREVLVHPHHDAGVRREADTFLRQYLRQYRYALVVFDYDGCGAGDSSVEDTQEEVQRRLDNNGWEGRSCVIALNPELEIWLWSRPRHVADILCLELSTLETLIEEYMPHNNPEAQRPKEAWEKALRISGKAKSTSLFKDLAEKASLTRCTDPAFQRLATSLRNWFPNT